MPLMKNINEEWSVEKCSECGYNMSWDQEGNWRCENCADYKKKDAKTAEYLIRAILEKYPDAKEMRVTMSNGDHYFYKKP